MTCPASSDIKRLQLALTADKEALFALLDHPDPELLQALLRNPAIDEHHLLTLLKQRGLQADLFQLLQRHLETRGSQHRLALAMACHPDLPSHLAATLFPCLHLFELAQLCRLPQIAADQRLVAERLLIQRLPTQPLGNKLALARQATATIIEALIKEGQPQLLAACLDNPRLKEGILHQFVGSAAANAECLSLIARHPRWQHRPNLQLAILKNPRAPEIWFTLWLPRIKRSDLRLLAHAPRLSTHRKALITAALGDHA